MKPIKVITIQFNESIEGYEIAAFRGAISNKVGTKHEWFHNHNNETNGYHYRYPRIQYKRHHKKPMLVCIENGIEEIHKYFAKSDWSLTFSGKTHKMSIEELKIKQFDVGVMDNMKTYHIKNWIALNHKNYKAYQNASPIEQLQILERSLSGHIISFLKGIDYKPKKRFEVVLDSFPEVGAVKLKKNTPLGFSLDFKSNLLIPNHIGLGKSVSLGFGTVTHKN